MLQSPSIVPKTSRAHERFGVADQWDDFGEEDAFFQTPSLPRTSLTTAIQQLRQRGWRRGVYILYQGVNRVYVGQSMRLPERINEHLWHISRFCRNERDFSVQVFHFPNANAQTLRAREHEYKSRFPRRFKRQTHTADDEFAHLQPSPINRLERGIHGYFPFPRGRRERGRMLRPVNRFTSDGLDNFLDEAIDAAVIRRAPLRPGTRCTEAQHRQYYGRVNRECKTPGGGFGCSTTDTIDQLFSKSARAQTCATARQAYQRRCFARSHPDWQGHEIARNQAERASRNCWVMGRDRQTRSGRSGNRLDSFLDSSLGFN
jgi:predicted GIY-YIG superfamily endonuclease